MFRIEGVIFALGGQSPRRAAESMMMMMMMMIMMMMMMMVMINLQFTKQEIRRIQTWTANW